MTLKLGDIFPNFNTITNEGNLGSFHDWMGESWAILFSHPADFTPVCTTELARAAQLSDEFKKRNVKLIALSCDSAETHNAWIPDIISYGTNVQQMKMDEEFPFPIIDDEDRKLATSLGMIDPDERTSSGLPLTARAVFVIGPDKRLKLSILYPATTGRNFNEILRVIDSLQLTKVKSCATPADWKMGDKCMVIPSIRDDDVKHVFPDQTVTYITVPSQKNYLRMVESTPNNTDDSEITY